MASDFGRPSRHLRGSRDWAQAELGVPPPQQHPPQPGSGGGSGGGGSGRGGGSSSSGGGNGAGGGGGNGPSHPDELGAFRTVALPPPRPLWSCPASLDLALKYHHELRSTLAPRLRAVAARLEKSSFHLDEAVPTLDLTSLVEAASTGGAVGGGAAGKGGVHEEAPVGRGTALPTPPPPSATSAEIAAGGPSRDSPWPGAASAPSTTRRRPQRRRLSLLLSSLSTTQQQLERAHLSRHFLTRRFDFGRRCTAVPPPGSSVEWIAEQLGKNLIGGRAIKSAARLDTGLWRSRSGACGRARVGAQGRPGTRRSGGDAAREGAAQARTAAELFRRRQPPRLEKLQLRQPSGADRERGRQSQSQPLAAAWL